MPRFASLPHPAAPSAAAPTHRPTAPAPTLGNHARGRLLAPLRMSREGATDEHRADHVAAAVYTGRPAPAAGRAAPGDHPVAPALAAEIDHAHGAGRPLPSAARATLRRPFSGVDGVRLHTDDRAHRLATALGAEAFTVQRDIFFRRGALAPHTPRGRRTLLHELAHSEQQRGGERVVQRKIWKWDGEKWGGDTDGAVLADVGVGKAKNDQWNDLKRVYVPANHWGDPDHSKQYFIPSATEKAAFTDRTAKQAKAATTLAGCDTLAKLVAKLPDAGFNATDVPDRYLEATQEYATFKAKKKGPAGARAKLALRLLLRDVGDTLPQDMDAAATTYMTRARARQETTDKMSGMTGKYKWDAFAGTTSTDFGKWALRMSGAPPKRGTMNCWEAVLWGAHKAGHISRDTVRDKYLEAKAISAGSSQPVTRPDDAPRLIHGGGDTDPTYLIPIEQALARGAPTRYNPHDAGTIRPLKGDIVVYGHFGGHVALAKGNTTDEPKVYSLWDKPEVDHLQEVPITEFIGIGLDATAISIYRPSWA